MRIKSMLKIIKVIFIGSASQKVMLHLAVSKRLDRYKKLKRFVHNRLQKYGVYISPNANIGLGLKLPHPIGVVVGDGVVIGDNVRIFQNVTLGGGRIGDAKAKNYPIIGNNVTIFSGAVVVGRVCIGSDSVIGANAVVLNDVPCDRTCVGVPGKLVNRE